MTVFLSKENDLFVHSLSKQSFSVCAILSLLNHRPGHIKFLFFSFPARRLWAPWNSVGSFRQDHRNSVPVRQWREITLSYKMLHHSGIIPEIPFLWISARSYEVAKEGPCSQGIFSSPLALVLLQPNLWHVLRCFQRTLRCKGQKNCKGQCVFWQIRWKKACMVFTKLGSVFWEVSRICVWQSRKFWPCLSNAFFAIIQHTALHHGVRFQSFTNTAIPHGRLKALDSYLSPPALTRSAPCQTRSRQKSIKTLSSGMDVLGLSRRHNAKVFVLQVETASFWNKAHRCCN